ncbi:MAG: TolC family protein [Rhodospirillales bacterium]
MRLTHAVLAALLAATAPALAGTPLPHPTGPYPADTLPIDAPDHVPHTLSDALGIAYETNPQLTGERAKVRATDENLPAALAGWRPIVSVSANWGAAVGRFEEATPCASSAFAPPVDQAGGFQASCYNNGIVTPNNGKNFNSAGSFTDAMKNNRGIDTETGTITQYLYRGGKTTASTHQADNSIYAERARLIAEEEQVFSDTINAYVTYVEDTQLLALNVQNEQVLGDELRAVDDRYRVGELTRTDVAQAEAALAAAIAQRQTAEGNLQTAAATFYREVGVNPPKDLADPQPLRLAVASEREAADVAATNNPTVVAALFNEAEQKDAIDVAFSALGPQIFLQGQGFRSVGSTLNKQTSYGVQGTINLSLPIYQGGAEYATVRQARQTYQQAVRETQDAVRAAREQAVQAWDTLVAARAAVASSRIAVRSAQIAVEGTERQALVGSATTQDVLIQQQNLLSAQITLVQNVTSVVTSSYTIASATGRLTAKDLGLAVPLYDETAYYNAVKNRLWGTGDYAVHQPGR